MIFSASIATSEKGVLKGDILSLHDPCRKAVKISVFSFFLLFLQDCF